MRCCIAMQGKCLVIVALHQARHTCSNGVLTLTVNYTFSMN